ncbi:MAG: 23S rRNA (pseudouridine(1915)-N(3))-methyltransferase RlmH [Methylococcales bacterium]|jgi:23S rRNA (pseudouridine1915-N3)-methyltransferase|nr:23S rRNA (pseudouridine(1915)-N(3))-methyltransferase RlmH [Methylococcales bacterium]HIG91176.1 23S rRNA (pseudouridine(1915)-N(3))-methyltransferase RlmH [Methylococcaceae bacterium]MBT3506571.1 23S rRNA (pseudouridine(1915)-N(3))-methyltransferase RlmH [Methylococcales bacterium]MBT3698341.1 23S rRNA (pseudouridine(1915)-N(3))-methyltransferase RlmH [Methylococcales bacterium]MBT4348979.1 23S rRNA (pseudouridine(1915)-N(3))-methyltransferase RlmH [Methylococcales bacterium]
MQIFLVSVGNKMPGWVTQGYQAYARRMPRECELVLKEVAPGKRSKNSSIERLVTEEGDKMAAKIPTGVHRVALDLSGRPWSTPELAAALNRWQTLGKNVALLVGGPDGLAEPVLASANESWCLSNLTFPHPLVRIVVAEQIYRAWSLSRNHPYHR